MSYSNSKDMGRYPLALPHDRLLKAVTDHVAPVHQRIGPARRQNCCLSGLRDTLLSKLLRGEIDLSAAEVVGDEIGDRVAATPQ